MSQQLPDVQASSPEVTVGLNRVGVTGVEKLVKVARPDQRPIILMAEFEVFVDLPSWRKGADMSRNMEVIDETLEEAVSEPTYRVEDVCGDTAERLLDKHDYTTKAEVRMEAEYVIREETPASGRPTQSSADIIAAATATEEEGTTEKIGARVTGMTVCPCSQGMSASRARETLRGLDIDDETIDKFLEQAPQPGHSQRGHATLTIDKFLEQAPQPGHSQRGHATLTIESSGAPEVDLNELIEVARDSMSARIYNMAKRPDEDHMTYQSHQNAKFVEDCVRSMAEGVVDEFPDLPDDAIVTMKQSNDESIHQHNAHAERVAEFGTLRSEVDGQN